ncbi:serine--tRNA synthetase-like protein Slimp [Wyeomyia smithii]|uniref:serine--tRNA synthetase-like protein Slimp n=1 Tax=Wyeomyia smithii TaxID=174621 RepID=UPI002467C87C|nr:serine--tRNA synthetase-like protein Slimp [Wyeomyia smithii]
MLRTRSIGTAFGHHRRTLSSALYVTGDKAKEQYAPLIPYLDFQAKLADIGKLEHNLRLRRYRLDLDHLKQQWELYRLMEQRKRDIEIRRVELRDLIAKATSEETVNQLKLQATLAKADLKSLRESSYAVADNFVAGTFLAIPNELHERTPAEEAVVLYENSPTRALSKAIGGDWLEEYDSTSTYMREDAALMDLFLPIRCVEMFQDAGFVLFSNPDFVRTVLVEAAQEDLDSVYEVKEEVALEHTLNRLHLCGGSSMLSFLGYLTKLSVFPTALPLRLVANGKQYLYEKAQTSAVQVLAAAQSSEAVIQIFDDTLELYKHLYDKLGLPYRLVMIPAHELKPAEAMRVSIEVASLNDRQRFVSVGSVSYYGDFISKRIAFNYHEGKVQKFPHLVAGTVVTARELIKLLLHSGVRFSDLNFLSS